MNNHFFTIYNLYIYDSTSSNYDFLIQCTIIKFSKSLSNCPSQNHPTVSSSQGVKLALDSIGGFKSEVDIVYSSDSIKWKK